MSNEKKDDMLAKMFERQEDILRAKMGAEKGAWSAWDAFEDCDVVKKEIRIYANYILEQIALLIHTQTEVGIVTRSCKIILIDALRLLTELTLLVGLSIENVKGDDRPKVFDDSLLTLYLNNEVSTVSQKNSLFAICLKDLVLDLNLMTVCLDNRISGTEIGPDKGEFYRRLIFVWSDMMAIMSIYMRVHEIYNLFMDADPDWDAE